MIFVDSGPKNGASFAPSFRHSSASKIGFDFRFLVILADSASSFGMDGIRDRFSEQADEGGKIMNLDYVPKTNTDPSSLPTVTMQEPGTAWRGEVHRPEQEENLESGQEFVFEDFAIDDHRMGARHMLVGAYTRSGRITVCREMLRAQARPRSGFGSLAVMDGCPRAWDAAKTWTREQKIIDRGGRSSPRSNWTY